MAFVQTIYDYDSALRFNEILAPPLSLVEIASLQVMVVTTSHGSLTGY